MFHIPDRQPTHYIALEAYHDGGELSVRLTLTRGLARNTGVIVSQALRDGTLKLCEPHLDTGVLKSGRSLWFRFPCPAETKADSDGLQEKKPPDCCAQPAATSTCVGSSPLGFLPDLGLGLF